MTAVHGGTPPAGALTTPFIATGSTCNNWNAGALSECMPPNFKAYWSGKVLYYSPGICPETWTNAGAPSVNFGGPKLEPTETAMVCCPIGWNYQTGSACTSGIPTTIDNMPVFLGTLAFAIQVRWASSDLSILATHPLTPGKVFSTTTSTTSQSTASQTATPTAFTSSSLSITSGAAFHPDDQHHGLTTAAKVGIGLGIALFVSLGALIGFILMYRKSKQIKLAKEAYESTPNFQTYSTDMNSNPAWRRTYTPYSPNIGAQMATQGGSGTFSVVYPGVSNSPAISEMDAQNYSDPIRR